MGLKYDLDIFQIVKYDIYTVKLLLLLLVLETSGYVVLHVQVSRLCLSCAVYRNQKDISTSLNCKGEPPTVTWTADVRVMLSLET